ncbi:MAG: hypothetical protein L0K86_18425, partial [Actinomycetia bacterium]|nr:hypothetical protein [Actinomycetes bacterium]
RRWNGHEIIRRYYARGSSRLNVPGVVRMPAPGEYVASPALVALIERDTTIAALFDGMRRTGVIAPDGLIQPHEFRAVVGIPPDTPLLTNVDGFGGTAPWREDHRNLNRLVSFFVLALVWIPVAAFVAVISRLSARQRSRRARSLRELGMSRRAVLSIHGIEAAVICAPAALIGAMVYDQLAGRVTSVPGTQIGFFSEPAQLGWGVSLGVAVLSVGVFAASAAAAVRRAVDIGTTGRTAAELAKSARRSRGLWVLLTGVVLLAVAPVLTDLFGGVGFVSLWVACALVAAGIGIAGAPLTCRTITSAAERARSVAALVGLRLGGVVTGSARLAGLLGVIVVLLLGGLAFTNVLNGGSSHDWDERLAQRSRVPVIADDLTGRLSLRHVRDIAPASGAVQTLQIRRGRKHVAIVFGRCTDLEQLSGTTVRNCTDRPQWIESSRRASHRAEPRRIDLPGAGSIRPPDTDAPTVHVESRAALPKALTGALLVPPELAPPNETLRSSRYFLLLRNTDLEPVMARLSAGTPNLQFDLGSLDYHNPATQRFPTQVRWLTVGTLIGLSVGVAAIAAIGTGEAADRSSRMRGLRVLGARPSLILRTHLWSTVTPIVLLGWLSVAIAWAVCLAMENVDDRAAVQPASFGWTALGVLIAALLIGLITYPAVTRRSTHTAAVDA